MTGQDALTLLMSRLGERTEPALRSICLLEMNLAQDTVLEGGSLLPWFLISEEAIGLTTAGERRVDLPDDFIRQIDEEKPLYYRTAEGVDVELKKGAYDELMSWYGSTAAGAPEAYAMRGEYFLLFPAPDAEYTLVMPGYYAKQADIADNTSENPWMKWVPDLVLGLAGIQMAEKHVRLEPEVVAGFKQDVTVAYDRLNRMEVAREEAGRHRRMG
jgi:hypothetical protein